MNKVKFYISMVLFCTLLFSVSCYQDSEKNNIQDSVQTSIPDYPFLGNDMLFDNLSKGYYMGDSLWPDHKVSVCWDNPKSSNLIQRNWVEDAIIGSWEAHSPIKFYGWGECGPEGADITISIEYDIEHSASYVGTDSSYKRPSMTLDFIKDIQFANSSFLINIIKDKFKNNISYVAVHEFGHALGLLHEQARPENSDASICNEFQDGNYESELSEGGTSVGDYDHSSVMNYCNPRWNNDGVLSNGDIATINAMYYHIYLRKDNILYASEMNANRHIKGFQEVHNYGWGGDIEIEGDYIYLMEEDRLYAARIDDDTMQKETFQEVDRGGWTGDLEIEGNYLYLMKNNTLWAAEINGNTLVSGSFQKVDDGGWVGDLEVEGNDLYLMKNDKLYAARIEGKTLVKGSFRLVSEGGWENDVEIKGKTLYLMKNQDLFAAEIDGNTLKSDLVKIDDNGWYGDLEFN